MLVNRAGCRKNWFSAENNSVFKPTLRSHAAYGSVKIINSNLLLVIYQQKMILFLHVTVNKRGYESECYNHSYRLKFRPFPAATGFTSWARVLSSNLNEKTQHFLQIFRKA